MLRGKGLLSHENECVTCCSGSAVLPAATFWKIMVPLDTTWWRQTKMGDPSAVLLDRYTRSAYTSYSVVGCPADNYLMNVVIVLIHFSCVCVHIDMVNFITRPAQLRFDMLLYIYYHLPCLLLYPVP